MARQPPTAIAVIRQAGKSIGKVDFQTSPTNNLGMTFRFQSGPDGMTQFWHGHMLRIHDFGTPISCLSFGHNPVKMTLPIEGGVEDLRLDASERGVLGCMLSIVDRHGNIIGEGVIARG